jgi:uncharacterized membrane protein (DUF373 family)
MGVSSEQIKPNETNSARDPSTLAERLSTLFRRALVGFESVLYGVVGLLLAAAAVFVLAGAVGAIVSAYSAHKNAAEISLLVLDRVLLALIVAELLYTLHFVVRTHEIVAEPFLFIGLIAVVRRILIVAGRFEQPEMGQVPTNLLLELGILGLLVLALAASIFLIRLSGGKGD